MQVMIPLRRQEPDRSLTVRRPSVRGLAHQRPGATAAVGEGLTEARTVNPLGVTGSLLRTLECTNPVAIEIVRDHATRVKHPD